MILTPAKPATSPREPSWARAPDIFAELERRPKNDTDQLIAPADADGRAQTRQRPHRTSRAQPASSRFACRGHRLANSLPPLCALFAPVRVARAAYASENTSPCAPRGRGTNQRVARGRRRDDVPPAAARGAAAENLLRGRRPKPAQKAPKVPPVLRRLLFGPRRARVRAADPVFAPRQPVGTRARALRRRLVCEMRRARGHRPARPRLPREALRRPADAVPPAERKARPLVYYVLQAGSTAAAASMRSIGSDAASRIVRGPRNIHASPRGVAETRPRRGHSRSNAAKISRHGARTAEIRRGRVAAPPRGATWIFRGRGRTGRGATRIFRGPGRTGRT